MVFASGWLLPEQRGSLSWQPRWGLGDRQGMLHAAMGSMTSPRGSPRHSPAEHGPTPLGCVLSPSGHCPHTRRCWRRGTVRAGGLLLLARWSQPAHEQGGKPGPAHGTGAHIADAAHAAASCTGNVPRADGARRSPSAGTLGRTSNGTELGRGRYRWLEQP